MSKELRYDNYPSMLYIPSMKHCGFRFNLSSKIESNERVLPENFDWMSEEGRKINEEQKQLRIDNKNKFPFDKILEKLVKEQYVDSFTNMYEESSCSSIEGGIVLKNKAGLAPGLTIEIVPGFINADMHNAMSADFALNLTAYGLKSLEVIFDTYGIRNDFLPELNFTKEGLEMIVPYEKPQNDNIERIFEINNIDHPDVKILSENLEFKYKDYKSSFDIDIKNKNKGKMKLFIPDDKNKQMGDIKQSEDALKIFYCATNMAKSYFFNIEHPE